MKGFLFTDNTTVHVENPQNLQKQKQNQTKLLKLTSKFSKTVGGKVYLQKSMALLYTSFGQLKTTAKLYQFQKLKYLGANLTKHMKNLYAENKILIKEIKEDPKQQTYHVHGLKDSTH